MPTPAIVTGLSVTARAAASVGLGWSAAANAATYEVHRAPVTSGVQGSFRKVNSAAITAPTVAYTDNAANSTIAPVSGSFYAYKVRGIGSGSEEGPFSDVVLARASAAVTRVEGFREDDVAPIFCDPAVFGSVAIWHKTNASDVPIRCIFDGETQLQDPDTGQVVTSAPQMWAATQDLTGLARNDRIEFSGLFYRVKSVQPDGTGLTVVELSKDQAA